MKNLNLDDDEPSSDIFCNPYMRSDSELKVGDHFRTKEDYVRAMKKFHMENCVDYIMHRTYARRYAIHCRNVLCTFRLVASYRKRNDSWQISSIHPPHTCIATNISQDHSKLNSELICQVILPLVSNDPSMKVSIIISHIVT